MYAEYFYKNTSTAATILSDFIAVVTGETTVDNLSANCDKTQTTITTSESVAGWTVHDALAGTNAVCIKAPVADNASQYKYVLVSTNSAGYLITALYETWNASNHTGTFKANASDTVANVQRVLITSNGRVDIRANARCLFCFSLQNGVFGTSTGTHPSGVLERTRLSPWDTVDNGYLPAAYIMGSHSSYSSECRRVIATGADSVAGSSAVYLFSSFGGGTNASLNAPTTTVPSDTNKNLRHVMAQMGFNYPPDGHLGGECSSLCDIWATTSGAGSTYDTIVYNGNTYVIWANGTTVRFAVRKG